MDTTAFKNLLENSADAGQILDAVCNIAEMSKVPSLAEELVKRGVCEMIIEAFKRFGVDDMCIAQACYEATFNLIIDDNSLDRFLYGGVCKPVVAAFIRFGVESSEFSRAACATVWKLSDHEDRNVSALDLMGVCGAIITVMDKFAAEDAQIAQYGCGILGNLAISPETRAKLGQVGGCHAVTTSLSLYGANEYKIAEWACAAVWTLAEDVENHAILNELNAKQAVNSALENTYKLGALEQLQD